ncbi:MAG: MBL fold metallo-hydrolase [Candidatus Paceibacterota bacterium]
MNERVIQVRAYILFSLAVCAALVWSVPYLTSAEGEMFTVTFLDVGQGDAILIETPDGVEVLIDGGRNRGVLAELARALGPFDRTIDMVVATHPDADHIGGLVPVLERYDVSTVLLTANESDTAVNDAFRTGVTGENAEVVYARAGQEFALGASTTMSVLFPTTDPTHMESNASSIVVRISYGETDILLTGDAPSSVERQLVDTYGASLKSEVLKAGHHGSRTSSDRGFVEVVAPVYGVISAGADNSYGHPHEEVLDTLALFDVEVLSTKDGAIELESDGIMVRVR